MLNNKFKTDIYNSESILVLALNYQIDLHILFHGDWTLDFDCYIPINSTNPEKKLAYSAMVDDIKIFIQRASLFNSVLLKLNSDAINYLVAHKNCLPIDTPWFDSLLCIQDILKSENEQNSLQNYLSQQIGYPPFSIFDENELKEIAFLAIYPTTLNDKECKPKSKKYDDDDSFYYPSIKMKNILITHTQLLKIVNDKLIYRDYDLPSKIIEDGFSHRNHKANYKSHEHKELHSRTANNASKIISALCELNKLDITQPYGDSNKEIMAVLERLGTPLSKDVIGDWLKLALENTK